MNSLKFFKAATKKEQKLILDTNVILDFIACGLLNDLFMLGYQFAIPNTLYSQELEDRHSYLPDLGLQILTLSPESVARVEILSQTYRKTSCIDLFALALAEAKCCPLLTGDAALRSAAVEEKIEVYGTLWLLAIMYSGGLIDESIGLSAIQKMQDNGRHLPSDSKEKFMELTEYDGPVY